jgi:hypothetical protein
MSKEIFDSAKRQAERNYMTEMFGEVISRYTRSQAIEDGVLADVSELAKQAGFKIPVALSSGVYNLAVEAQEKGGQDYKGVVWDILNVLFFTIKKQRPGGQRVDFTVSIWSKYTGKQRDFQMYSVCDGGDNGEPVITILLPNED